MIDQTGSGAYGAQGPESNARRELDVFDLAAIAWAQRVFIVLVFLALFIPMALGAYVALQPSYQASARLLILLDGEDPTPGAAGAGEAFIVDQIVQSEIEILNSDVVRRLAIEMSGGVADSEAVELLGEGFSIERAPNSSVLITRYEAPAPDTAANALNAIIDAYLSYRRTLLVDDGAGVLVERVEAADRAAGQAEDALRAFLTANRLVDFDAEQEAAVTQVTQLQTQLLAAQASAAQARASADALSERLRAIPRTMELYVENDVTGQLLTLQVRRRELLARYQADAPPVQAIDREIAALRAFIREGGAEGAGQRRVGVNPVYQELDSARLQQEAAISGANALTAALGEQLAAARREADRLRALAPEHQRLLREVTARALAAERLTQQSADASSRTVLDQSAADAVRVMERAEPPAQASSMRRLGVMGAFVFAFGIAMLAGLLRGYVQLVRSPTPFASTAAHSHADSRQSVPGQDQNVSGVDDGRVAARAGGPQASARPARRAPVLARVGDYQPSGGR
ncbi:MAG: Wzz/FepE/Etk N-terminal domain-containing protein [Pseudomonadota bacterium]